MTEELWLGSYSITKFALSTLARYKNLKRLHLNDTDIGDDAADYLSKIQTLELLDVSRTKVGDEFVAKISTLPKLKTLQLVDTKITSPGLKPLVHTPSLDILSVRTNMPIDDSAADFIKEMPLLTEVDVSKTSVGDEFVSRLGAKSTLRTLSMSGTRVTQKCFPVVAKMKSLIALNLDNDEGISDLSNLRNLPLTNLSLKGVLITVNTPIVRQISHFPKLKSLRISQTALRDSDLLILAEAPNLSYLEIFDCDLLTPKGIAAFKKLKPNCHVTTEDPDRKAKYEKVESLFGKLDDDINDSTSTSML